MNLLFVYPMFALVLLTSIVLVAMFRRRVRAVKGGEVELKYFKTYNEGTPGALMLQADRHYANLFELPILFYVACIIAMLLPTPGFFLHFWAWIFVAARFAHAFIHLGSNNIRSRMLSFVLGLVAVLGLWITLVWRVTLFHVYLA